MHPARCDILIDEIRTLVAVPPGPLPGRGMRDVPQIADAAVAIAQGRIVWFGRAKDYDGPPPRQRVSAGGGTVIPGLIDCHTHVPFAGRRHEEFVRKIAGESYLQIMQAGGGIRVTTQAVRSASEAELIEQNLPRLARMLAHGTTTAECKSGYGLDPEAELKQLRVIRELDRRQPIELVATYLGAHALPAEYEGRVDEFIEVISDPDLLKRISDNGLARFCDVFCDRGAFDVEQARRVLTRGIEAGLRPRLHADELAQIGATRLAGELKAISADHLECIDDGGIEALRSAGTIAVVLPGTSFFLGVEHADARGLIDAGLPVAVATDLNPGSSHIESLPFVLHIACCQQKLLPIECVVAATANAAAAICEQDRLGAIAPGWQADLLILDCEDLADWFYTPGRERVRVVVKRGEVVWEEGRHEGTKARRHEG